MAKLREAPCQYYVCKGECKKGRDAEQNGICQTCAKYYPRKGFKSGSRRKRQQEKEKYVE